MGKKILVVGGVAGGATAIARLRRLDEDAEIILFERGEHVSFANCGLPYYIGGVIKERDSLFVSDIDTIKGKYDVDIRNFSEVTEIDREGKRVKVTNLKTGEEYYESYDKVLLSTGSTPFVPKMEGTDFENVFTLWNIPDTDKVHSYIENKKPKKAVVVGAGFIGLEMAENLKHLDLDVTIVEFADQVMPPLDPDMSKLVENHLREKGVKLILEAGVEGILDGGKKAKLSTGDTIDADLFLLSVGVRSNSKLAKDAGLELNQRGGVIVDEYMQTSDPDIYAVGDIIEVVNPITGKKTMVPLAGPANKQGRAVAANMLGKEKEKYNGTIGTSIAKIFDLSVGNTGLNEKALIADGQKLWEDYGVALVHPMSHAGYYPGALPLSIKLIFSMPEGKILGTQIIGYEGVDKRVDTIATAIHFKGTVTDLTQMELAYAPPYSSAKDPVNMAGYVAENILKGKTRPLLYREAKEVAKDYTILDVRSELEQKNGMIEGAISMPLTDLRKNIDKLDKDKKYLIYCAIGLKGYITEQILRQKGYDVRNLAGGYRTYTQMESDEEDYNTGNLEQGIYKEKNTEEIENIEEIELDVCGMSCPGPIVKVSDKITNLRDGERLKVKATDPGFVRDIESWCTNTGNQLISSSSDKGVVTAIIQKGKGEVAELPTSQQQTQKPALKEKTMIIFDNDLDKAIAAFIIATGSAAMGNKVNMFFTFWGLSVIRKEETVVVEKTFIEKMFSFMMPKGSKKLKLSNMNFMGLGSKMMRGIMDKKGITSLEELIKQAQDAGIKMTACQMSMDVMGLTKEELIDGVEIGGVATMLNDNDNSNMNLFI